MTLLTASQITNAKALKFIDVHSEDLGGTIRLREINAKKLVDLTPVFDDKDLDQVSKMTLVLSHCIVDEDDNLIFEGQESALAELSLKVLKELFAEAQTLIGFSTAMPEAKKN